MLKRVRNYFARRRVKGMFGQYVSPTLVEQMVNSGVEPVLEGRDAELTPFFASVHAYVGFAEQASLAQLREVMNAYFDVCTAEIVAEHGTLDKFIGDAVVAMFGAPIPVTDHARRGCVAALKCQTRVAELRARWQAEGNKWPELARQLRVRVGLHTGVAMVGNMGTATRFNYTMMGDTVNLAARMETMAKSYGTWTLCTDTTQSACERADKGRVIFRSLGPVVVKGRVQPLELFELAALRGDASDRLLECIAVFESGLARWRERDWTGAIKSFEKSALLERDQPGASPEIKTNPSIVYLTWARSCLADPKTAPAW